MMRLQRLVSVLCAWIASTRALAPANPHGWDDTQPDGSPTGRLYLKGSPDTHVYIVDQHQHPVVLDTDGWYVYATTATNDTGTRRQLFQPTKYAVSPESSPPRHLQQEVQNVPTLLDTGDFMCNGQPRSLWCPDNNSSDLQQFGRSAPRTTGTQKIIVVLVKFSDQVDREMPSKEDYDFFFNGQGIHEVLAPTGTLQDFFRFQSVGQYTVEAHVEDWFVAPETEEYYSYGNFGITNYFAKCAYGALDRMDQLGFDFSEYDQDGDGVIDNVSILHSGFVAEGGGTDCINGKPHGNHRIWSHATSVFDTPEDGWYSKDGSIRLGLYSTSSAVNGVCGSDICRIGIVGHEYLHTLGLPDLLGAEGRGVGIYDVMGMCWGADGTLLYPATMGPWCRQKLAWTQPTRITTSGVYQIGTSQLNVDAYRIDVGFPKGEYLLLENRQKILLDAIMPGEGGLLIWHIDESKQTDWQSAPGWPQQEGWPGNNNHYQLALLSPDTRYDLETAINYGDYSDCWTMGTSLEPGPGRQTVESDQVSMYPNTDSYSGGVIKSTGIRIYDISELGAIMTFRVEIPDSPVTTPPTLSPTTVAPIPQLTSSPVSTIFSLTSTPSTGSSAPVPSPSPTSTATVSATNFPTLPSPTVSPTPRMPMSIPPAYEGWPSSESVYAASGSFRLSAIVMSVFSTTVMAATMLWL